MKKTVHTSIASLVLAILLFRPADAFCQKYDPGILEAVNMIFDGMRAGDSTMLRKAFLPTCTLTSISKDTKDSLVTHKSGIAGFIKAAGSPHSEKWDEQIYNVTISVDGPMAIVWAPYKFFLGEKFSHCGVNVFTLLQTKTGWKISDITDTRRKDDCR